MGGEISSLRPITALFERTVTGWRTTGFRWRAYDQEPQHCPPWADTHAQARSHSHTWLNKTLQIQIKVILRMQTLIVDSPQECLCYRLRMLCWLLVEKLWFYHLQTGSHRCFSIPVRETEKKELFLSLVSLGKNGEEYCWDLHFTYLLCTYPSGVLLCMGLHRNPSISHLERGYCKDKVGTHTMVEILFDPQLNL